MVWQRLQLGRKAHAHDCAHGASAAHAEGQPIALALGGTGP